MEGFRKTLRSAAFCTPQARQAHEGLWIKPILRTLRTKMLMQEFCLALHQRLAGRDIDVRLVEIAVPLWNFVFQNEMVAECIPRELRDLPVILMRIIAPMAEYHVGGHTLLQRLEPSLELGTVIRKKTIPEGRDIYSCADRVGEKRLGRCMRFLAAPTRGAEHGPVHLEAHAALNPAQDGRAGANLDVVRVGAETEHRKLLARSCQPQEPHPTLLTLSKPVGTGLRRHGIVPFSTRSSRTCLSLRVSMGRQKPSCLKARS